jgi:hypothetical protein
MNQFAWVDTNDQPIDSFTNLNFNQSIAQIGDQGLVTSGRTFHFLFGCLFRLFIGINWNRQKINRRHYQETSRLTLPSHK